MKKYTLENSFHRTSATILVADDMIDEPQSYVWHEIELAAYNEQSYPPFMRDAATAKRNRISRKLCGVAGCCCGTVRK